MKVLVVVKRVVDYNVKVRAKADGSDVDMAYAKMSMNPFDEIAVEEALRLEEAGKVSEIIAVSLGGLACEETLRLALAMGAHRAILVHTEHTLQPIDVAQLLQKIVERTEVSLVVLGKQAIDDDAGQTGQMLAALLAWGQGTFASKLQLNEQTVQVTREIDGGLETLELNLPAVITTDLRLNEPRYVKLPNIMLAKKKPLERLTPEDLQIALKPRLNTLKVFEPSARVAGIKVANVAELVSKLSSAGVLR